VLPKARKGALAQGSVEQASDERCEDVGAIFEEACAVCKRSLADNFVGRRWIE
jgi:hypothetical protein